MEPYPARIVKAYRQVDSLGLVNYWRNLYGSILAAGSLEELKREWEYCFRVSDHDNPLFAELEQLKNKRKTELN